MFIWKFKVEARRYTPRVIPKVDLLPRANIPIGVVQDR
jgi:hypothetical protein